MEAVILAGGFGTRLRDVVSDVPKPMAPVNGRPFLELVLKRFAAAGFTRVVLAVGYKAEVIEAYFGKAFGPLELVYTVEDKPLGTGGAIRKGLECCHADRAFIFNGDTYLGVDFAAAELDWQRHRRPLVICRAVPDTARYGRIEAENEAITGFAEKGIAGPGLINAGCYLFPRDLLGKFPPQENFSIETDFLMPRAVELGFRTFVTEGTFIDIGIPDDYFLAQKLLADL